MRKKYLNLMMVAMIGCTIFTGCGKEKNAEKETASTILEESSKEEISKEETTEDLTTADKVTSESMTTEQIVSTDKQEETTKKKQEITTTKKPQTTKPKQEVTTTKKPQTTKPKQEVTTTKKSETTKPKQEATTTKKPQTTTSKQETTTVKKEETTTQNTVDTRTWFDKKGYTITSKANATSKAFSVDDSHDCDAKFEALIDDTSEWVTSKGLMDIGIGTSIWCDYEHDLYEIIPFDRYTGNAYSFNGSEGEFEINGKKISYEISGSAGGGDYFVEVICTKGYDGVVFLVAKPENLTYKGDNLTAGSKIYTIDEVYDFDKEEVFFMTVDDK